jgi:hypothetical protein
MALPESSFVGHGEGRDTIAMVRLNKYQNCGDPVKRKGSNQQGAGLYLLFFIQTGDEDVIMNKNAAGE